MKRRVKIWTQVISAMDASMAVPTAALAGIVVSGARAVLAGDVG